MYLTTQASVIVERSVLSGSYTPERLLARETQIQQMLRCLSPVMKGYKPLNLWLHGPPGTGKTSAALHLLNHLKEKGRIRSILINCWQKDSFYEILDEIVAQLRILGAEEHRTGLKLDRLRKCLGNQPFLIVLDEIDRLRPMERSTTLYNLSSLANVGIICISNSQQPLLELEDRVRSRLNPYMVFFAPYSPADLAEILKDRAQAALAADYWSEETLLRVVALADGDARMAISALQDAAELAEQEHSDKISTHALEEQRDDVNNARHNYILSSLTEDHRMLYQIVKQQGQTLSGDLWQQYLQRCASMQRTPLASRTFSEYVNRLAQTGLVISERARVKGKVRLLRAVAAGLPREVLKPSAPIIAHEEPQRPIAGDAL